MELEVEELRRAEVYEIIFSNEFYIDNSKVSAQRAR